MPLQGDLANFRAKSPCSQARWRPEEKALAEGRRFGSSQRLRGAGAHLTALLGFEAVRFERV